MVGHDRWDISLPGRDHASPHATKISLFDKKLSVYRCISHSCMSHTEDYMSRGLKGSALDLMGPTR